MIPFVGYSHTWSVVIFTLQLLFNGAVTAGYLGNGLDIAPNFSGTIFGLANTLSSMSGYFSSLMIGELTAEKVWKFIYIICTHTERYFYPNEICLKYTLSQLKYTKYKTLVQYLFLVCFFKFNFDSNRVFFSFLFFNN